MRVVVGGGGQYGPFDEITTLSMAGGDCGRGRALWSVRRTTALKWTLGWYPDSFLDPRTSSLEISADVVQPQWLSVHRTVKISISQCEPRRSCSDITYPSAVCDLWDPRGMGPHCQTAKSRKSDIHIQQNIVMESGWIPGSLGSQTDFRILESQIGVLTDLLLCGWDLSTSEAAYTAVAGSSSSQLYSSSRSPVVLYKIFSNPFSFIRRSSFMKLNIEINHLQTWISRPTQHDFRN